MSNHLIVTTPVEKHECLSYQDGDEIIYRCPLCPQYERRFNIKTGKTWVSGMSKEISHSGCNGPEGMNLKFKDTIVNQR